jgi:hypothetical protein
LQELLLCFARSRSVHAVNPVRVTSMQRAAASGSKATFGSEVFLVTQAATTAWRVAWHDDETRPTFWQQAAMLLQTALANVMGKLSVERGEESLPATVGETSLPAAVAGASLPVPIDEASLPGTVAEASQPLALFF